MHPWSIVQADALTWLRSLPPDSASLCLFSPPYERARLYLENGEDLGIARGTEEWVAWMLEIIQAALVATNGLVVCVCEGQTRQYRYSCAPALLMADLHRAGVSLRKPVIYRRVGIPGSGGPDWWRNDWEWCLCCTRGGKLPWSDNTATGHAPKWAPGGAMSHRLSDGARVNQWGGHPSSGQQRRQDGGRQPAGRPSHQFKRPNGKRAGIKKTARETHKGGELVEQAYVPPVVANPGNVIQQTYTAEEVAEILGQPTDVIDCTVGGGQMGSKLSHQNEAPYPEALCEPFIRSFCPEGGLVIDPFTGSGTTGAVALRWGRRFAGCDLRQSQVELARQRLAEETTLFHCSEESPS